MPPKFQLSLSLFGLTSFAETGLLIFLQSGEARQLSTFRSKVYDLLPPTQSVNLRTVGQLEGASSCFPAGVPCSSDIGNIKKPASPFLIIKKRRETPLFLNDPSMRRPSISPPQADRRLGHQKKQGQQSRAAAGR